MAYLIFTLKKSTIKIIKKAFEKEGCLLKEHNLDGKIYLVSYVDPKEILPREILRRIKISQMSSKDLRELDRMPFKRVLESMEPKPGRRVKIIKGAYEGFQGIILKELNNGRYQVAVSIFGMSVPIEVRKDEIEVI